MRTHEALPEFAVVGDLPLARSAIVMRKGSSPLSSASFSMRFSSLMTFVPCPLLELPYLGKEKIIEVQRRCAHLSGDTITLGSEPCLRSASALSTNVRPISCAYSRMRAWTVLCSVGVGINSLYSSSASSSKMRMYFEFLIPTRSRYGRVTSSFNPVARTTGASVDQRGLPFKDSMRYRLSRGIPACLATSDIPCASATLRRACRNTAGSSSSAAAVRYSAAKPGSLSRSRSHSLCFTFFIILSLTIRQCLRFQFFNRNFVRLRAASTRSTKVQPISCVYSRNGSALICVRWGWAFQVYKILLSIGLNARVSTVEMPRAVFSKENETRIICDRVKG